MKGVLRMKSKLLVLGLSLTCLLGLSACGSSKNTVALEDTKLGKQGLTEEYMLQYAENIEGNFEYFYTMGATKDNFEDLLYTVIVNNSVKNLTNYTKILIHHGLMQLMTLDIHQKKLLRMISMLMASHILLMMTQLS